MPDESRQWRTEEAQWIGDGLSRAQSNLQKLDDTLVHYSREHHMIWLAVCALAEALGEPMPWNEAQMAPSSHLNRYVQKVRALTGLPKLVVVDGGTRPSQDLPDA